jgi:transcriptional regulator with PAS, ATPase and Fis domain
MLEIYRQVRLIAEVNVPVLILGETGTGKEVVARLIHKLSQRSGERLLNVNCAALPTELMESELFGHRQGAFTGALRDQRGMLEKANRGTLLLDEIGEISVQMQAKLLHVIQDGQFTRLGGQESTKVDVRILAATNVDMECALAERTFREDLYYRLNTFTIKVPPLRERREEIPYLIEEIIRRTPHHSKSSRKARFCARLMDAALAYNWRGNLRELRNFVTRALVIGDQDGAIRELETKISAMSPRGESHRPRSAQLHQPAMRSLVREVKNRTEVQMIQDALESSGWNRRRAAEALNISYRGLLYKIHQHHLVPDR